MGAEDKMVFSYADMEIVERERRDLARLYTFLRRYITKTIAVAKRSYFALGVVSFDGVLLDLFAKEESLLDELHGDGIQVCAVWRNMGYNAVEQGQRFQAPCCSVGDQNGADVLKKYAVYFAPIHMLSPYEPFEPMERCGLVLLVPVCHAWEEYETMVTGIAHDMMITIQFNNIATMYYERSGKGLLSIDNMMSPHGEYLATYYNDELFRILGLNPVDMYYQPVVKLIDPPPANKALWDIVNEHKTLKDYPITIKAQGKSIDCIVTTDVYNQPSVNAHGVTFYITTHQRMVAKLSEKMANGAVKNFDDIIGEDPGLKGMIERAKRMAATESNIMILGESGTGKDVFAQAIHNASRRRDKPFIALNCGAMPRDLIESELFGYESGAFTGARKNGNMGKFELAMGGTVFLDEIGEMPLDLQAKLLRVVEQKEIMRLGGSKMIKVDVKIIAATNVNIWEMIERKKFRADLFYRLSTMRINLMPLRERRCDIVLLAEYFIRRISEKTGKTNIMRLSPKAKELLSGLEWYGNVRELQNLIECIVQLYPGDMILPEYIMENLTGFQKEPDYQKELSYAQRSADEEEYRQKPGDAGRIGRPDRPSSVPVRPSSLGWEEIQKALEICGNNRSEAAKYLGISRRSLYRKLEELGMDPK